MTGYSILLCTYNGALRLPATLQHLAAVIIPTYMHMELVVVNNAGTDDTDTVVTEEWKKLGSPFPLSLLHMPTEGKGHALALGISKAKGRYVVICDDDNWLASDYLLVAEQYFTLNPKAAIISGKAEAVADAPLPDWFAEKQWAFACGQQPAEKGNTTAKKLLWSAGMILQKDLANTIFNGPVPMLLLGRTGKQLVSGEDDEICYRAWLLGKETHYVPELCIQHYMEPHRLTLPYFENLVAGFTYQSNTVGAYHRCYQYMQYRGSRFILLIKKWLMLQWYRIQKKNGPAAHAADMLYFLTGQHGFETPINRQVKGFYDEVVKKHASLHK